MLSFIIIIVNLLPIAWGFSTVSSVIFAKDKNEAILFLGEWCRLYSRKFVWNDLDAIVVLYHWDNREKILPKLREYRLKNKEKIEGFYESVVSKKTGKKVNFFNLGFNNRWEKILDKKLINKMNDIFKPDFEYLGYESF